MSFPIQIQASDVAREVNEINRKLTQGIENLNHLKDADVDIGSTPKDVIHAVDRLQVTTTSRWSRRARS
jgi:polyhydroxyalkanoate synthase